MGNENVNLTKVIVPCRFSYLHCWEPNAVNDGDPKYSVSAIIPKSDTETIGKIQRAIEQAKKDSVSKWGGKVPANLKLPLRDGDIDRPEDEAYADSYFFNANSKQAPQVVDRNVQADSGPVGGVFRVLWADQCEFLWVQQQREPWDRGGAGEYPEAAGRGIFGRQDERRG